MRRFTGGLDPAALTFLVGFALTCWATHWQSQHNVEHGKSKLREQAQRTVEQVEARFRSYEYGLRGARGIALATGPEQLSRSLFRRYGESRDIDREFPGARGIGIVKRVQPEDEARFLDAARLDGKPDFSIRQLAPHPGERYVVQYIEPAERNREAIGLDLASEAERRQAAEEAMRTGRATLTAPLTNVQANVQASGHRQPAFLLLLPIYRTSTDPQTAEQRVAEGVGWSYAPLFVDEVLRKLEFNADCALALRDARTGGQAFYDSRPTAGMASALTVSREMSVLGRTWQVDLRATPHFLAELNLLDPRGVAAGGLLVVTLVTLLVHLLVQSQQQARLAHAEQARRASIVDGSSDAIIGETLDGKITDWNRAAERLFGYPREVALGRSAASLFLPEDRKEEDALIRAAICRGETVEVFDTTRLRADGRLIDVAVSASPVIGVKGRTLGFAKVLRDISEAKRAEHAALELNTALENQVRERTLLLERARHDLSKILDSLPSVVSYWDAELRNRFANGAYRDWFGIEPAALEGVRAEIFLRDRVEQSLPKMKAALRGEPQRFELTMPFHGGPGERHAIAEYLPDVVDGEIRGFYAILYDITEQTLDKARLADAAEKLRASEAFLNRAGRVAGIGAWQMELQTQALSWSEQMARLHELEAGYVPKRGETLKYYPPEAQAALTGAVSEATTNGTPWDLELPFTTARGHSLWVRSVGEAEREDGKIVRLVGSMQDITARKLIEHELQKTSARIALATDGAGIGIWEFDIPSNSLSWDTWMYRLYGVSAREASEPYETWARHVHPSDRERSERELELAQCGEREFDTEFRIIRADGQVRHLKAAARVARDPSGKALRMTGVNFDITERKRAELDLRETSSLLKTVLASASEVSIIATDPQFVIKVFNRGAEKLLGYSSDEVVNRATPSLIHDADEVRARGEELTVQTGELVAGSAVFTHPTGLQQPREWTYIRKDGSRVPVTLVMTAMLGEEGELFGYLGVAHDVTRQKQHENSLNLATQKAEQANIAKSQFLANMSHEIRTPLNAVLGISYVLGQTVLDSQQAALLSKIHAAGKSLLALINDILDLSKIEAGELTVERVAFDPNELLEELAGITRVQAESKGIDFKLTLGSELPAALLGDVTRLRQILTNLVANAIKFTARGGVELRVREQTARGSRVQLLFEVLDTGIGIAPEQQARLFSPFAQADASTTRRFGGTGLGLSIVKRLCALLGGDVGVTSKERVGSVFWASLEFELASPEALQRRRESVRVMGARPLSGLKILVVDDSELNQEVARRILELEGANVSVASRGGDAIERLKATPDGFDLVLMDVQMPELDGHQTTRLIRQELGLATLPIVALTADARASERELCEASGMNGFVSKPFEPRSLVRTISQFFPPSHDALHAHDRRAQASLTSDWPEIEGIEGRLSRERMGGMRQLFLAQLASFLVEFGDLDYFSTIPSLDELKAEGGRVHKLRGASAQIGAEVVSRLAGDAETACREGERSTYLQVRTQLEPELRQLLRHIESCVAARQLTPPPLGAEVAAPTPAALEKLQTLLRQQSLSAVSQFELMAPALLRSLGPARYTRISDAVNDLHFTDAAALLEAAGTPGP